MSTDERIVAHNLDQRLHEIHVQFLLHLFNTRIVQDGIRHDMSKWQNPEYYGFVESRSALKNAASGTDSEYKKHYLSTAIQHHVTENAHHPEYWIARKSPMPLVQIIIMYFDWCARSIQNGKEYAAFRQYNLSKLKELVNADVSLGIILLLEQEFPFDGLKSEIFSIVRNPDGKKSEFP